MHGVDFIRTVRHGDLVGILAQIDLLTADIVKLQQDVLLHTVHRTGNVHDRADGIDRIQDRNRSADVDSRRIDYDLADRQPVRQRAVRRHADVHGLCRNALGSDPQRGRDDRIILKRVFIPDVDHVDRNRAVDISDHIKIHGCAEIVRRDVTDPRTARICDDRSGRHSALDLIGQSVIRKHFRVFEGDRNAADPPAGDRIVGVFDHDPDQNGGHDGYDPECEESFFGRAFILHPSASLCPI